jgi:PKD repeat protein
MQIPLIGAILTRIARLLMRHFRCEHVRMAPSALEHFQCSVHLCMVVKFLHKMNMIRTAVLAILLMLPLMGSAQCSANISYSINCLTVQFAGIVQPQVPNLSYYWWFSDGNNSSVQQNPSYTFSAGGTYTVCFSIWDSLNQCSDSVCVPITVAPCGCTADFTALDTAGYWYFLPTTTATQPASYYWDFGDGNNSTQQYPWHQYANPGTYTVCLTVYDSLQNFCDSTCHVVIVQGQGGCTAGFTSIDSLGYTFFFSSTTAGGGAMYFWDFGDGNYSSAANPAHVYGAPGTYQVCLTVYDSLQNFCDSTCHMVQVSTVGVAEELFLQSLNAAPNPADGSMFITFNAINSGVGTITFFDATGRLASEKSVPHTPGINKTEFNTATLPQGNYLVRIAVNGNAGWTRIAITHQ